VVELILGTSESPVFSLHYKRGRRGEEQKKERGIKMSISIINSEPFFEGLPMMLIPASVCYWYSTLE
jgi:hypothetical protein